MTKEQLFESLNSIDDDILLRSEKTSEKAHLTGQIFLKAFAIAACFAVFTGICISTYFIGNMLRADNNPTMPSGFTPTIYLPSNTPKVGIPPATTDNTKPVWNTHYAKVTSISASLKADMAGYFTEELSMDELNVVLPDMITATSTDNYSGYAGFDHTGRLLNVYLNVKTGLPDSDVNVQIANTGFQDSFCYELDGSKVRSLCGSAEFYLYIYESTDSVSLYGEAKRDGVYYHFVMHTTPDSLDRAKHEFSVVLKEFSNHGTGLKVPDLSLITPDEIPEYRNDTLSLKDAATDPDFGSYMLTDVPNGWQTESVRRYIDQNYNYLSGLWTHGYNSLSWRVSYLSNTDSSRITDAADTINYDLSLYPIPRAESVPEKLREIVDNPIFRSDELTLEVIYKRAYKINDIGDSKDYRMHFSILYGDILVEVSTKGISPEWLYKQLSGLIR